MDKVLVFLDCAVNNQADRSLQVYKKSMEQYLLTPVTLHNPTQAIHVIQLLNPRTQMVPSMVEGKKKEK